MTDNLSRSLKKKHTDSFIAFALCLIILLLGLINLDNNCNWGDDFAAYMADGIAMAEGRYEEQTKLNVILRSGKLVNRQGEHVHVWGYPVLHALVYSIAGFDTQDFSNLYLYKLPSLIALALMSGVCYLLFTKRLERPLSFLLALALCSDMTFYNEVRNLCSDIVFMALSISSFHLMELYLEKPFGQKRIAWGILLGILLWYSYSVRLNGIVTVVCVLLSQLLWLAGDKKRLRISELVPTEVFLILFAIFNLGLFPQPTSTSSAGDAGLQTFLSGCSYYFGMLHLWARHFVEIVLQIPVKLFATVLYSVFDSPAVCAAVSAAENFMYKQVFDVLGLVILLLSLLGIVCDGIKRDKHIVFFILISFLGTAALNLGQELRYLYVLLPHLTIYAALGAKRLVSFVSRKKTSALTTRKAWSALCMALTFVLCFLSVLPAFESGLRNLRHDAQEDLTAYSTGAIELYNYIQNELDEDATVAFFKPRALYLNTGRVGLLPQEGGFEITDADYYLYYIPSEEMLISEELESMYELKFSNYEFMLFEKTEG